MELKKLVRMCGSWQDEKCGCVHLVGGGFFCHFIELSAVDLVSWH